MTMVSCGIFQNAGSGSEAGNSSRIALLNDSLLVKIPTSATGDSSTVLTKKTVYRQKTFEMYDSVRGYIGFANQLVHNEQMGLKKLIAIFRDSLPWDQIEKVSSVKGTHDGLYWCASYNDDDVYQYQLSAAYPAKKTEPVFTLLFNGNATEPQGCAYYRLDLLEPGKVNCPLKIAVSFKAVSGTRQMNVSVESDSILGDSDEGFRKLSLQLVEKEGILHLSGASYHPHLLNLIPDTTEYCYEFYGVCDVRKNLSVLYVGLPPASIDNNDFSIMSNYGIASVIARRIIRQDIRALNDTLKQCVVTSYKDKLTLKVIFDSIQVAGIGWLHPANEIEVMALEEFFYFIEINKNINSVNFLSFIDLLELTKQPVYFDRFGYVANGEQVPGAFKTLAAIKCLLSIQNPQMVRNLSVVP
jgi:hypothetical protein